MYLTLRVDEEKRVANWLCATISLEAATDALAKRKTMLLSYKKGKDFKAVAGNIGFLVDLEQISSRVPLEILEFSAYMCMAHWLLPDDQRNARTKLIDDEFKQLFPDQLKVGLPEIDEMILALRSSLKILPDSFLSLKAAEFALLAYGRYLMHMSEEIQSVPYTATKLQPIFPFFARTKGPMADFAFFTAQACRTATEVDEFIDAIQLLQESQGDEAAFLSELQQVWASPEYKYFLHLAELAKCVVECAPLTADARQSVIAVRLFELGCGDASILADAIGVSKEAYRLGKVNPGPGTLREIQRSAAMERARGTLGAVIGATGSGPCHEEFHEHHHDQDIGKQQRQGARPLIDPGPRPGRNSDAVQNVRRHERRATRIR